MLRWPPLKRVGCSMLLLEWRTRRPHRQGGASERRMSTWRAIDAGGVAASYLLRDSSALDRPCPMGTDRACAAVRLPTDVGRRFRRMKENAMARWRLVAVLFITMSPSRAPRWPMARIGSVHFPVSCSAAATAVRAGPRHAPLVLLPRDREGVHGGHPNGSDVRDGVLGPRHEHAPESPDPPGRGHAQAGLGLRPAGAGGRPEDPARAGLHRGDPGLLP